MIQPVCHCVCFAEPAAGATSETVVRPFLQFIFGFADLTAEAIRPTVAGS